MSVAMIDLDHFKGVNDTHGHVAGDLVLRETARAAMAQVREGGCLARYGGEEFGVILPATSLPEAIEVAEMESLRD